MLSEVILHLGLNKTGSTAIQSALQGYDDGQTIFPKLPLGIQEPCLFAAFAKNPEQHFYFRKWGINSNQIANIGAQTLEILTQSLNSLQHQRVIVSGELLGNLKHQELAKLINFFKLFSARISAIAYVRDPESYARSAFQQRQKTGNPEHCVGKIKTHTKRRLAPILDLLTNKNLTIVEYDRSNFRNECVITDFYDRFQLDHTRKSSINSNTGLSSNNLRWVCLLNCFQDCLPIDQPTNLARQKLIYQLLPQLDQSSGALNNEPFLELVDYSDNAWLKENFGVEFPVSDKTSPLSLSEWLADFDEESIASLYQYAKDNGIGLEQSPSPSNLIRAIYFSLLGAEASQVTGAPG